MTPTQLTVFLCALIISLPVGLSLSVVVEKIGEAFVRRLERHLRDREEDRER